MARLHFFILTRMKIKFLIQSVVFIYSFHFAFSLHMTMMSTNNNIMNQLPSTEQTFVLCRMICQRYQNENGDFDFSVTQIDEFLRKSKVNTMIPEKESGLLPLRFATSWARRDVVNLLLRHGSNPFAEDANGVIIQGVINSDRAGNLLLLTDLLSALGIPEDRSVIRKLINSASLKKLSTNYLFARSQSESFFPRNRLDEIKVPRLEALKYRVIGQSYALEQITGEIASHFTNTELSKKPLVLLFAGPPGHGKSETAKQIAEVLDAPFHKVDCRNHANPWEMFGSGAGYIGSDSGSQLARFIESNCGPNGDSERRSVVLLDEFDHCDPATWEAFYHIFDEGEFTLKRIVPNERSHTRVLDCSSTIWLLTTNKFDNDIVAFNERFENIIQSYKRGGYPFDLLNNKFEDFIRPKLRDYFQGGLTRRINSIVPFFCFDETEAYVITDLYIDKLREMYQKPPNKFRKVGNFHFDVTNFAIGELSRNYMQHKLDGASAIIREVNNKLVKKIIHMNWLQSADDKNASSSAIIGSATQPAWIHFSDVVSDGSWGGGGLYLIDSVTEEQRAMKPYFATVAGGSFQPPSSVDSQFFGTIGDFNREIKPEEGEINLSEQFRKD